MKVTMFVVCLLIVPIALWALDLQALARKERARRKALAAMGSARAGQRFTDRDLERYARHGKEETTGIRPSRHGAAQRSEADSPLPPRRESRDLESERESWRKEADEHRRELARIDARIRRLQWRLTQARSKKRPGGGVRQDPALSLLSESLEALYAERRLLEQTFRERARRAGAFPGWLR